MDKREALIISAHTGVSLCDFPDIHEYVEKVLGRPIWTHEFARPELWDKIKEKTRADFLEICENVTDDTQKNAEGWWVSVPSDGKFPLDAVYATREDAEKGEGHHPPLNKTAETVMYEAAAYEKRTHLHMDAVFLGHMRYNALMDSHSRKFGVGEWAERPRLCGLPVYCVDDPYLLALGTVARTLEGENDGQG